MTDIDDSSRANQSSAGLHHHPGISTWGSEILSGAIGENIEDTRRDMWVQLILRNKYKLGNCAWNFPRGTVMYPVPLFSSNFFQEWHTDDS